MKSILPEGALKQHLIALGKTGSGKSSVLRLLVEGLLDAHAPICIIDPKGDWWGLKSSADGRQAGYPIIIFGGEHADMPLNAHAGGQVAELVATGNRPCIIDLGGWMVSDRTRFFIDFATMLFRTTRGPRYLVIDEVHNFAPQGKVMDPDAGKMLHWANRLASEGRGKGITLLSASQRPQKVHKDFVTCAETLVAMRVIHPLDRNAVKDWIDGCPDSEKGREVLATLATMPRGTAWCWSPEIDFGPARVAFPKFSTYDSFAAPAGETIEKLKGWAEVDLEEIKGKLAAVVEEADKNDPRKLRARIAELERATCSQEPDKDMLEEAARDGYAAGLRAVIPSLERMATLATGLQETISGAMADISRLARYPDASTSPQKAPIRHDPGARTKAMAPARAARPRQSTRSHGQNSPSPDIGNGGLRRIMVALAQRPAGLTRRQIGVRAGLASGGGSFNTYLSKARSSGWAEGSSTIKITEAGLIALGPYDPLPTGQHLLEYWLQELGNSGAARILRALANSYPRSMNRTQVGDAAGMSSDGGSFNTYLSKLRTLELITGRGELLASEELFQ